jgi:anoctamin-10
MVDLVIAFRTPTSKSATRQQIREDAKNAERQYSNLIDTITRAGLSAVGRRGETQGHILVFVSCPQSVVERLAKRER